MGTIFKTLWLPQKILTDQGQGFESQLFQELMSMARIEKLRTTTIHRLMVNVRGLTQH